MKKANDNIGTIIWDSLDPDEQASLRARAKQRVVRHHYARMKRDLLGLGITVNGHLYVSEDGQATTAKQKAPDLGTVTTPDLVAWMADTYTPASLAEALEVSPGAIYGWAARRYSPGRRNERSLWRLYTDLMILRDEAEERYGLQRR